MALRYVSSELGEIIVHSSGFLHGRPRGERRAIGSTGVESMSAQQRRPPQHVHSPSRSKLSFAPEHYYYALTSGLRGDAEFSQRKPAELEIATMSYFP
jgi:hypothetical protein